MNDMGEKEKDLPDKYDSHIFMQKEMDFLESTEHFSLLINIDTIDEELKAVLNFTHNSWLVSILNTIPNIGDKAAESDCTQRLFGHTAILVEGVLQVPTNNGFKPQLFYGYYHIGCRDLYRPSWLPGFFDIIYNPYGKLVVRKPIEAIGSKKIIQNKIKSTKIDEIPNSYRALPEHVLQLILSIKDDYHHYLLAEKGYVSHYTYQLSGSGGWFSHAPDSHNCASWCVEKMKEAYIDVYTGLIGIAKLIPRKISNKKMQDVLSTFKQFENFLKRLVQRQQRKKADVLSNEAQYTLLGRAAYVCGQYEEAVKQFNLSLSEDNHNCDTLHHLALAYVKIENYQAGFECLLKLLAIRDKRGDAWYQMGLIMYIQEAEGMNSPYDSYKKCFSKFAQEEGSQYCMLGNYGLASIHLWQGEIAEAIRYGKAALDLMREDKEIDIRINILWAWLLIEDNQFQKAIEHLNETYLAAKEQNKEHLTYVYRALTIAYLSIKDSFNAEFVFEKAIQLNSNQEICCWNARVKALQRNRGNINQTYLLAHFLVSKNLAEEDVIEIFHIFEKKFSKNNIKDISETSILKK